MILVIGDIILDDYRIVDIHRVSPEAPCLVGRHQTEYYRLGGAANVANNIKALTRDLLLVGECCDNMQSLIEDAEIPHLIQLGRNSTKIRFIDKKSRAQVFRYDVEETEDPSDHPAQLIDSIPIIPEHEYKVQVIVDYLKGTVNKISQVRCPINIFSTKNPYPSRLIKHRKAQNVLVLNKGEFDRADKDSLKEFSYVVRTEGEDGISVFDSSLLLIRNFEALRVDVFDVTGAGDTVTAIIAFCTSQFGLTEDTLAKACFCANVEAAKVIAMHGTAIVTSTENEIINMFNSVELR